MIDWLVESEKNGMNKAFRREWIFAGMGDRDERCNVNRKQHEAIEKAGKGTTNGLLFDKLNVRKKRMKK